MAPTHASSHTSPDRAGREEFTALVTEIRELCRVDGKPLFQVTLDRSPFLPTEARAGTIVGTLTATSRMGSTLVAPITAVHQDAEGELWHTTAKPLQQGTVVICSVGDDSLF